MFLPVSSSLRQFARAVTADRLAGDELADAVARDANRAVQDGEPPLTRAALFRRFVEAWREIVNRNTAPRPFSNAALVRGLGAAPDEPRMVLLLTDICGFTRNEVETILAPLSKAYDTLLAEGRSIVRSVRRGANALVVEDEPLIAADLKDVLEDMGVAVIGMARTAEQAAREVIRKTPDIVLADYNLDGRKTGVDAVTAFQEQHSCPVIFITGYPDEVLKGEDVEPDFVIVKPYRPEAVQAAVAHCLDTERFAEIDGDAERGGA